jgi:phosphatidylinositol glycan class W
VLGISVLLGVTLLLPNASEGFVNASINANQLFVFLISNLSTGAINLSMYTLYASLPVAMLVLSTYLTGVCTVASVLNAFKINTVFWK